LLPRSVGCPHFRPDGKRVEFVAADMPEANRFMLHIMAAVTEHEREMISQRTRTALAVAKARGTRFGNPRPDMTAARSIASSKAAIFRATIQPQIQRLHAEGRSLRETAAELNAKGLKAPRGGAWHPASIQRLCRHG